MEYGGLSAETGTQPAEFVEREGIGCGDGEGARSAGYGRRLSRSEVCCRTEGMVTSSAHVVANVLSEWLGSLETPVLPASVKEGLEDSPRMCYLLIDTILAMVETEEGGDD